MNFKDHSFAGTVEHRLRRVWPKAMVEYIGGGWFAFRAEPLSQPTKMRRDELRAKADAIRSNQN